MKHNILSILAINTIQIYCDTYFIDSISCYNIMRNVKNKDSFFLPMLNYTREKIKKYISK
jgi:hypothetical protein